MTNNNHPITPPPELVKQWATANGTFYKDLSVFSQNIAIEAARWGADQELEACVEWLGDSPVIWHGDPEEHPGSYLREARRPKPPSLKEQSLALIDRIQTGREPWLVEELDVIRRWLVEELEELDVARRALEALPDD